jgi:hypothetical protein
MKKNNHNWGVLLEQDFMGLFWVTGMTLALLKFTRFVYIYNIYFILLLN